MDDPNARDRATSYRKKYPVASYCTTSSCRRKSRRRKSRHSEELHPGAKNPVVKESSRELIQNAEDDKKPVKERTQRTIPVGALQNTFQTGRICVQRIEFEQRLIYEGNAIEEERLLVGDDCAIIQCTNRGKKNGSTKQSTTIREELATSVDC
ncbi:hypothetical protein F511_38970 [Dorcoceras hygrometricum]|uniref:Uncharacterized protein n=1 Tax=Dorcoceras hygrometricum TaxID=472368 RepID=A0A2Z7BUY9_9LAMI|nr:hypothetical protein F511_38970 [Dorcoceras hygrometricum]